MTDPLDDMLDLAGQHARNVLIERHEERLMPVALMIDQRGDHLLVPMVWDSEQEKVMLLAELRAFMQARGVTRYSMLSEAWTAAVKGHKPYDRPPPSERPDRKEAVVAVAADKTESKSRMWTIVRGDEGMIVALKERTLADNGGGRMAELLREQ